MTVDSCILRFRSRQEDLFRDEATVSRPGSGAGTISSTDNVYTPAATTEVYSGPCLLRAFTWEGTSTDYGDVEVRLRRVRAKFPVDTDVQYNDIVTPSASTYDESMVGIGFRVTDAFRDGWQIARVAILEEITE